jgi:aminoglycoside phosphotransferase family enzyme
MVNAHTSIHATGEEQNFYSTKNFPARFAVNLELAQSGIRKLLNNDLQHIVEIFEKLQGRMVNEIPMGFLEKRISNGFVKFSHADTKTDNIYIHNNKVIFLDAVVIKPMWQCTDRIEELAALVISSLEESNDNLVSAAMNAYRPLDKDLTNQTIKFFWMLCANWSFVRGIVSLLHAIVKKKDGFSVEDHLNKARPRFETAIKFAETALSPLPSFHFE